MSVLVNLHITLPSNGSYGSMNWRPIGDCLTSLPLLPYLKYDIGTPMMQGNTLYTFGLANTLMLVWCPLVHVALKNTSSPLKLQGDYCRWFKDRVVVLYRHGGLVSCHACDWSKTLAITVTLTTCLETLLYWRLKFARERREMLHPWS